MFEGEVWPTEPQPRVQASGSPRPPAQPRPARLLDVSPQCVRKERKAGEGSGESQESWSPPSVITDSFARTEEEGKQAHEDVVAAVPPAPEAPRDAPTTALAPVAHPVAHPVAVAAGFASRLASQVASLEVQDELRKWAVERESLMPVVSELRAQMVSMRRSQEVLCETVMGMQGSIRRLEVGLTQGGLTAQGGAYSAGASRGGGAGHG